MKLSVIVPVYNEYRTVGECIRRVLAAPYDKEIIVVDDASSDGTRGLLRRLAAQHPDPLRLVLQPVNRGKGAALRLGIEAARGDVIVIQDADLEYDPEDYARLVPPIESGQADVVYGSRFLAGPHRVLYYWHSVGNRILTTLSNLLTNLNLTDMETCYKAFRREVIQNLVLESDRFGFEPEVTAKLAKSPCVLYEVPISYHGRTYAEGKKITWLDGLSALVHVIRYNVFRRPEQCFRQAWHEMTTLVARAAPPDYVEDTLALLANARRYNRWMYGQIKPYLGKRIVEIGSGIGNFTGSLVAGRPHQVLATDVSFSYLERLRDRFDNDGRVKTTVWNLTEAPSATIRNQLADSAVCLNVLEHIEDDRAALRNIFMALRPSGRLILLVPAHPWLYGSMDEQLGHFRRYRRSELRGKLEQAGFEVEKIFWMNAAGMIGWFMNARVLKRPRIPPQHMKLFEALVPVARLADAILTRIFGGLSLICIARRPAGAAERTEPVPQIPVSAYPSASVR